MTKTATKTKAPKSAATSAFIATFEDLASGKTMQRAVEGRDMGVAFAKANKVLAGLMLSEDWFVASLAPVAR